MMNLTSRDLDLTEPVDSYRFHLSSNYPFDLEWFKFLKFLKKNLI